MIEYSPIELETINGYFPNLYHNPDDNIVKGELNVSGCYIKDNKKWNIEIDSDKNPKYFIQDVYDIEIRLDQLDQYKFPKVFETGGKIKALAKQLNKRLIDLHVYPNGGHCCLGIPFDENLTPNEFLSKEKNVLFDSNITLNDFVLKIVYPYFFWQAYYSKYKKIPPCGEYSHQRGIEEAIEDVRKNVIPKTERNQKCSCGSGKKYKLCCLPKINEKRTELVKTYKPA